MFLCPLDSPIHLLEVLQKQKPTHIGIAFDTAAKTFRDEIFKEYKATRQEIPEDIRYGIPKVKEIIRGFNIPILEMDGYEADDIIGTMATQACKQGFEVYMMTPDKDFGQLVNECVFLYKPAYMGNAVDVLGVKEVCEKWDIDNVSQVIDMLGLQGDSSDNIPGIPGFGPKTAADIVEAIWNGRKYCGACFRIKRQAERSCNAVWGTGNFIEEISYHHNRCTRRLRRGTTEICWSECREAKTNFAGS